MRTSRNLNRLAYFVAVVEAGSFTAAAERLGVTKAVVSQQVARLEQEVGATLLIRGARVQRLTAAGRGFYDRCADVLREADEAFAELAETAARPAGLLRITAPFDYGEATVAPAVAEFVARYPDCQIELLISDRTLDLDSWKIDLAVHVGWLEDSTQQARRIGVFRQMLVCSPGFAERLAGLDDPRRLADLPFVANAALRRPRQWSFAGAGGETRTVEVRSVVTIDATPVVRGAVLAGAGLSVLPDYAIAADLRAGRLIEVLAGWSLPSGGVHAVFPAARYRPAGVRAFVDLLTRLERTRTRLSSAGGSSRVGPEAADS